MRLNWKKNIIRFFDIVLGFYILMAVISWNTPSGARTVCTKVDIKISDSNNAGFLSAEEIKHILVKAGIYPLNQPLENIKPRDIEEALKVGPFVKTAQCYITQNGQACINISQRMPIVRIKNIAGNDYYLDDNGGILPNSKYTSDLIIATGSINLWFARFYITPMAKVIAKSDFWTNQIEQINVLPDRGIELVPRVGNHILFIGYLPVRDLRPVPADEIAQTVEHRLSRLQKFYRYGLSQAGWKKYSYISVEFDNQIICRRYPIEVNKEKDVSKQKILEETANKTGQSEGMIE